MTNERDLRLDAIMAEYLQDADEGRAPERGRFLAAHPDLAGKLGDWLDDLAAMDRVALPDAELPVGSLLGPYRLESIIGRGGMGTVYKARHGSLQRVVAIKVLAEKYSRDPDLVNRFRREARALAQLEHPNIVRIYDMGEQGERHFFVMEYVEGVDLRQLMQRGEMSPERALAIVPQVCLALEAAHEQGIVHRDIKPENILLDTSGQPRIADFGLAKVISGESQLGQLTRTDLVMGTYNYMAPEQKRTSRVDHRVDIYALGVVLYEMLTGRLPEGRFDPPSHESSVDERIDDVVLKALASEPDRRYQHARDMGRAVSDVTSTLPPERAAGGASPAAAAARLRTITVVDQDDDSELGGGQAHWIRLVKRGRGLLKLRTWNRTTVGVSRKAKHFILIGLLDGRETYREVREHGVIGAIDALVPDIDLGSGEPVSVAAPTHERGSWHMGQLDVSLADARCVEVELPKKGTMTVNVPPGLPVEIVAPKADVTRDGPARPPARRHGDR